MGVKLINTLINSNGPAKVSGSSMFCPEDGEFRNSDTYLCKINPPQLYEFYDPQVDALSGMSSFGKNYVQRL